MTATILQGDCLSVLATLPDQSVQCCVTSPPYYGLRDYGTAKWEGGDPECDHKHYLGGHNPDVSPKQLSSQGTQQYNYRNVCAKCGAVRIDDQIGLEETPDAYVAKLVAVFREVRRVLRDDGTLWLNLGDSYAGSTSGADRPPEPGHTRDDDGRVKTGNENKHIRPNMVGGEIKVKDLVGIPWMVAFALRADGWYLRQDIIWHKPNPMPESVKDRCTKAHEYIFLLAKSQKYYYDAEAVSEPVAREWDESNGGNLSPNGIHKANGVMRERGGEYPKCKGRRNRRSVWTVTTKPFKGAHFATFPPDLIEPCVLAGTSEKGCCPKCGKPWVRVIEKVADDRPVRDGSGTKAQNAGVERRLGENGWNLPTQSKITTGWQPTCECGLEPVPCVVLDPFNGAGTTGMVALKHGREYIGIELNLDYIELTHKRLASVQVEL